MRESETQISDWEGDGENLVLDEVAGWDDAEFNASPMIERESPFKLFVGNVPFDMDSEMLAQLFQEAGVVEIAEVWRNWRNIAPNLIFLSVMGRKKKVYFWGK